MLIFFFRSVLTEEYKVPDGMVGFSMYCLMSTFFFFFIHLLPCFAWFQNGGLFFLLCIFSNW